ncbi:peptidoglycan-binding domain-containing protein [Paracoccus sanguinis]|uniref:peptidoglycan-binding domain-containing protein n=1 Tax=Paracoccus sanguinis TaxID=1545044 RepID=UPI001FD48319|nr:peptidoglycan-binding protein [Paracoccus sanguinis]
MTPSSFIKAATVMVAMAVPAHADDTVKDIVGGIAKQYLQQEQDRAAFAQAQSVNTLSAYQSYLRQFPNGAYASHARDRVERLGGTTPAGSGGVSLSAADRVEVQRRLNALGYSTGGTDGSFGPGTRRAIALWQRDRNYAQTGTLTRAQATEILRGRSTGDVPSAGSAAAAEAAGGGSAAQTERALGLSIAQRSAVQAGLTRRGFDTRGVDGTFGPGTRRAIANWQRANDLSSTGYLTGAQFQRLTTR